MKGFQVRSKLRARPSQPHLKAPTLANPTLDLARQRPHAGLLMSEAADYLRYSGDRAAEKALRFLRSKHVILKRRGRTYLVTEEQIEAALSGAPNPLDVAARVVAATDRSRPKRAAVG